MRKFIGSLIVIALLALLTVFGLNIFKSVGPRTRENAPDGSQVVVEEMSYYIGGSKVFGRLYKPADENGNYPDSLGAKPVVIFFHEPLKTDFPESVIKSLVPEGLIGYVSGFRDKEKDIVSLVKRMRREKFTEPDMVFLIGDNSCGNEVVEAASKLGSRIQGLVLIEPRLTGKANELYLRYGKEFLTIDSSSKGNAVTLIEDYLETRGALK